MDKAVFKEKVDAMMPDLVEGIRKECSRLYDSRAVDTGAYEDNYQLPKIILAVVIENQIRQYSPLTNEGKKEVKNLRHF